MNNFISINFFLIFLFGINNLFSQVTLDNKSAVQNYFEGTWELSGHYYGIGGWYDVYPRSLESYHINFTKGTTDSTLLVKTFRNFCLKEEKEVNISNVSVAGWDWQLKDFPEVFSLGSFSSRDRFSLNIVDQDSIALWDGIFDGSELHFRRSNNFEPKNCMVPEDFEFLDHQKKCATPGAWKATDYGIVYVSNQSKNVSVNIAYYDNTIEEVFASEFYIAFESRIEEVNDSTFHVFLYGLFDYDISYPGYTKITFSGSDIQVSEDLGFDQNRYYVIDDLVRDSTGFLWCSSGRTLLQVEDGEITDMQEMDEWFSLHSNWKNDIYILSRSTKLSYFDGTNSEEILTFNSNVYDLISYQQNNYILLKGELIEYNEDFSEQLHSWNIPESIRRFNQINFDPDFISIVSSDTTAHEIKRCLYGGVCHSLYKSEELNESWFNVLQQPDSTYIIAGTHESPNIVRQVFLRSVPVIYEPDYYRTKVDVETFEVKGTGKDTINFWVSSSSGDTIWNIDYDYDVKAELYNDSEGAIYLADAFSSPYSSISFDSKAPRLHVIADDKLEKGNSVLFEDNFTGNLKDLSYLLLTVPGADFRINDGNVKEVDFDSKVPDPTPYLSLSIYPNPSSDRVHIDIEQNIENITIHNLAGQLVYFRSGGILDKDFDISFLGSGTYSVSIKTQDGQLHAAQLIKTGF